LVDVSLTTGDGFCIRAAAWVFALSALGLGQQRVNYSSLKLVNPLYRLNLSIHYYNALIAMPCLSSK
jgi:hypothetical protein